MREIKIKAWSKKEKVMLYFSSDWQIDGEHCNLGFSLVEEREGWFDSYKGAKDEAILMQYTGLKDKNGKEIYEGDIIKIENWSQTHKCSKCGHKEGRGCGLGIIAYQNESITDYGIRFVARFTFQIDFEEYELDDTSNKEIIGNIYENPELLKKEKKHENQARLTRQG